MKYLAILVAKILSFVGAKVGRGTNMPGSVAYKIDKKILHKIKYPSIRIFVTGSSGKGSTTKIIANTLLNQGYRVCCNFSGANMRAGIISTILTDASFSGKLDVEALIVEVDERNAKFLYEAINPTHVVVTNLTKDQPPRQHDIDFILADLLTNLPESSLIITNMDDPFMRSFEIKTPNKIKYFSIDKYENSYTKQIFENLNTYRCPQCNELLKYEYYNIETLGKYSCGLCGLSYKRPDEFGFGLDLKKGTILIGQSTINIGGDALFNAYNTMAAYTTLKSLDIDLDIVNCLNYANEFKPSSFDNYGKHFLALNCKAENATTYNQAVYKACCEEGLKDYVIGWKEISRRYNHFDLSWLYDIQFELINDENLNLVYVCGIDAENIKNRLILAGIDESKILVGEDIASIKEVVLSSRAYVICGILNFDYMDPFIETFKEDKR